MNHPQWRHAGGKLRSHLEEIGEVIAPELVDSEGKAARAGEFFRREDVDIHFVFPFGYTPWWTS